MHSQLDPQSASIVTTTFLHSPDERTQLNPSQNPPGALKTRFLTKKPLRQITERTHLILPALAAAAALALPLSPARAVIIGSGDGTANTTQGAMPAGWNNVGTVDGASAVYLGSGWVITAAHVGGVGAGTVVNFGPAGSFTSNGNVVRLQTGGQNADLQMFHLTSDPALPSLNIPTSSPTLATSIYMVGYGRNRDTNEVYYVVTVSGSPPNQTATWTPTTQSDPNANAAGYQYATGNTKRWGTNLTSTNPSISGSPTTSIVDAGFGPTQVFFANFYGNDANTPDEAQLSNGDSGGGVFDASNNLIGLINYKGTFLDQPADTAIFGNLSDMADLSAYRSQILTAMTVPEPTTLSLFLAGGLVLATRRRRCRTCQTQ